VSVYAVSTYGNLGRLIKTRAYYDPQIVEPLPEPVDRTSVEYELYKEECKARAREMKDMAADRPRLYAAIWGQLSLESKDKVREAPDWADIEAELDPLRN
jgi:hypothetical protein